MILNYGKNQTTLLIGGSYTGSVSDMLVGTGSSTILAGDTELVTTTDRQTVTSTTYPAQRKVQWQFDWNSVEISGTAPITEFGNIASGTALTGSLWSRDVIPGLTFDGTNELRIEAVWEQL